MYKHYDKDGTAISLHDSRAEKATFENGVLTFYFACVIMYLYNFVYLEIALW